MGASDPEVKLEATQLMQLIQTIHQHIYYNTIHYSKQANCVFCNVERGCRHGGDNVPRKCLICWECSICSKRGFCCGTIGCPVRGVRKLLFNNNNNNILYIYIYLMFKCSVILEKESVLIFLCCNVPRRGRCAPPI
jgi:hypothetical protein